MVWKGRKNEWCAEVMTNCIQNSQTLRVMKRLNFCISMGCVQANWLLLNDKKSQKLCRSQAKLHTDWLDIGSAVIELKTLVSGRRPAVAKGF